MNPVHLTLDTELAGRGGELVRTYISRPVKLGENSLATEFVEIPNDVVMADTELIGMETLSSLKADKVPGDLEALERSLSRLQGLVDAALRYVEDVVVRKGDAPPWRQQPPPFPRPGAVWWCVLSGEAPRARGFVALCVCVGGGCEDLITIPSNSERLRVDQSFSLD